MTSLTSFLRLRNYTFKTFSLYKGKNLEHMKLQISPGFKFYGLINILGLKARCEVEIGLPFSVKVDVELMPIQIAKGALVLSRGKNDMSKGPRVFVKISAIAVRIHFSL